MNKLKKIVLWSKSTMKMMKINYDHNYQHIKDVVYFSNRIIDRLNQSQPNLNFDKGLLELCVYMHDVGRVVGSHNHEEIGGNIAFNVLKYNEFADHECKKCKQIISEHAWLTTPTSLEAMILKDSDKLGYIGLNRWKECDKHNFSSNGLISRLNILRDNLILDESKEIFDEEFPKFKKFLSNSKNFRNLLGQLHD